MDQRRADPMFRRPREKLLNSAPGQGNIARRALHTEGRALARLQACVVLHRMADNRATATGGELYAPGITDDNRLLE